MGDSLTVCWEMLNIQWKNDNILEEDKGYIRPGYKSKGSNK